MHVFLYQSTLPVQKHCILYHSNLKATTPTFLNALLACQAPKQGLCSSSRFVECIVNAFTVRERNGAY